MRQQILEDLCGSRMWMTVANLHLIILNLPTILG